MIVQRQKVIKLLRLAEDRKGTPEGDTAQRLAETIMKTHGITVEQEAVGFETSSEIVQVLFVEDTQRRWWQEMLLVSLCDIYGGEAVPMEDDNKHWRLYVVVEPADEVDTPRMQLHFAWLCNLVLDLCDACAFEFMRALPLEREESLSSFRIGVVFRISQLLYQDTNGEEHDLQHMPFMIRALKVAESPETVRGDTASLAHTDLDSAVLPFAPPPFESAPPNHPSADVIEVVPDWSWFDCGWRHASRSIHHVHDKG